MWRTRDYYARDAWRGRWDTEGGGVLVNQAIHAIDMFQWLMGGEVEEVVGRWTNQTHPFIEVEDTAAVVLRFKGGALGSFAASTSVRLSQHRIAIHGSKGHSVGVTEEPEGAVGYNDVWTIPGEEDVPKQSLAEHVERGEYIYRSGRYVDRQLPTAEDQMWPTEYEFKRPAEPNYHARQIADLVKAIQEGRKPLVDAVEGRKSVAILLAIYESGRTGQPVKIPELSAV
jgi:predicted dehydrogenase